MKRLAVIVLVVGALAASATLVLGDGEDAAPETDPAHTPPSQARLVVVTRRMPEPSPQGMTLNGKLERGRMPQTAMHGTVLTDTECTPGFDGVSRCRNEIRLADGTTIVVRHPHDMSQVPTGRAA